MVKRHNGALYHMNAQFLLYYPTCTYTCTHYTLQFQYLGTSLLEVMIQNDAKVLGLLKVTHSLRHLLMRKQ